MKTCKIDYVDKCTTPNILKKPNVKTKKSASNLIVPIISYF